jgi:hypothetical protein
VEQAVTVLASLAVQLPLYLVWAAGAVVAVTRYGRHPRPSTLVLIGLLALFVVRVGQTVLDVMLPEITRLYSLSLSQIAIFIGVLGFVTTLLEAAAWALVLVAAFGWRRPA